MKRKNQQETFPLNKAIRLLREYHGLKQFEAAERLGFSKSVISELESGARPTSLDVLTRYAEVFKMPVSSVMLLAELQSAPPLGSNTVRRTVVSKALKILEWLDKQTGETEDG